MPILTKGSPAARAALIYVTVGALVLVWTAVYYFYLLNHAPEASNSAAYYFTYGFLATGLILLLIGFGIGRLGRSARSAELPPPEVTAAIARAEQNAAARAPIVAANPAAPVAGPVPQPMVPAVTPTVPTVPTTAPVPRV